jgi:hypothetical protein
MPLDVAMILRIAPLAAGQLKRYRRSSFIA